MRAITEESLRLELRNALPETYHIPAGKILTPAGREYLQQRKIKIVHGQASAPPPPPPTAPPAEPPPAAPYVDYETGGFYGEKPEHMTQLSGNLLVAKNHPRIFLRGKLDSLQAQVVLAQVAIAQAGGQVLTEDLGELLAVLREITRCEVLEEAFHRDTVLGLTSAQLREYSHHPQKFFGIAPMVLPDYAMGREYALLNGLRTAVRETETAAVAAFQVGGQHTRDDIVQALNRLSSALYIMMCRYLGGEYR